MTQILKIEIDGCHPYFDKNHTPGICDVLEFLTQDLKKGVQLFKYPFYYYGEAEEKTIIAKISLVEGDDNNDQPVKSLSKD